VSKKLSFAIAMALVMAGLPHLALAMEAFDVPEPSSALMLLSSIPAVAIGWRMMRGPKR
jgi:hypothetical protein